MLPDTVGDGRSGARVREARLCGSGSLPGHVRAELGRADRVESGCESQVDATQLWWSSDQPRAGKQRNIEK